MNFWVPDDSTSRRWISFVPGWTREARKTSIPAKKYRRVERAVLPEGRVTPLNGERWSTNSTVKRQPTMMNDLGRRGRNNRFSETTTPINPSMWISILIAHVGVLQLFRCNLIGTGIATSLPERRNGLTN